MRPAKDEIREELGEELVKNLVQESFDDFLKATLVEADFIGPSLQGIRQEDLTALVRKSEPELFRGPGDQAYYDRLVCIPLFSNQSSSFFFNRFSAQSHVDRA